MQGTRISVVIPTRDRCNLCRRAATSVLEQIVPPWELLICDDGSADETPQFFADWAAREPRLRYLPLGLHGGPATARNAGIDAATGDWIAFLDDDDTWRADKLAVQESLLGQFDIVAANALRSDGNVYFPLLRVPLYPDRAALIRTNPIVNSTAIVRRTLIEGVGGFRTDPRLAGIEDYCLWLDLADANARFVVLPDVLVEYDVSAEGRLSDSGLRTQRRLARHFASRARSRPSDLVLLSAAFRHAVRVLKLTMRETIDRPRPAR